MPISEHAKRIDEIVLSQKGTFRLWDIADWRNGIKERQVDRSFQRLRRFGLIEHLGGGDWRVIP